MTKRRYPQFFDQEPSLTMVLHESALIEKKASRVFKPRKKEFVPCQECKLYSPVEDGLFGCKRKGICIYS